MCISQRFFRLRTPSLSLIGTRSTRCQTLHHGLSLLSSTKTQDFIRIFTGKDIDAEIERTEKLISRLFTERSRLYKEKNEMRSPIYSLPTEVLALIFEFTCPPLDFLHRYGLDGCFDIPEVTYPHITGVLCAVSTQWHNVVSSTPSLWASLVADDDSPCLMQMVFARSGDLPISASFSLRDLSASYQSTILNPILREHAPRIHILHVRGATRNWLNQHISRFIHLESLCLEDGTTQEEILSVENPCAHFALKKLTCRISLAWSKIRVLHLTEIPVGVSLEMLGKCTHLIEFRLRDPVVFRVGGVQLPSSPFTLPCLELFEWPVYYNSKADRPMLQYARMPALQTLIWNRLCVYDASSDALLESFFEHFSLTLATLQIEGGIIRSGLSMFSHFLTLSGVKHLIFEECSDLFINDVFSKLASEMCMSKNREMLVLPKLQSIYIDNIYGQLDQEKVLQIFRRRCSWPSGSLQENSFRLEVTEGDVDWTPGFRAGLTKMVEEGYKVELWENSKSVDWLSS